ncbi:MAG: hypothetical protein ACFFBD_17430, partial [Candidatus Hodarchaeota archaeon]
MLTPVKVEVCKITAYVGRKRRIIRALHKINQIEIYDMEKKATTQTLQEEEEKKVYEYLSRMNQVIDFLQPEKKKLGLKVVNEEEIETIFVECDDFLSKIEPKVDKIRRETAENTSKITDLKAQAETLSVLIDFDFNLNLIGTGEQFFCTVGQIPGERLERFKFDLGEITNNKFLFLTSSTTKKMITIVVGVNNQYKDALERILTAFGFLEVRVPPDLQGKPREILTETERQIGECNGRITALKEEQATLATENASPLYALKEQLEIENERIEISKCFREDQSTI